METDEVLKKMHSLHLVLADELKRICENNDIKYFMIAGTLLGAIRHKGFIPWDDDMDFGMLRADFERFLLICEKELDTKKFYLQTDRKEKYYIFNFAKLRLKQTKVLEDFSKGVNTEQGIYIDIFPIDAVPDQPIAKLLQFKKFWFYRNLLLVKCGYGIDTRKKKIGYKVGKILSNLFSVDYLKNLKQKSISKYEGQKTKFVVTSDGSYGLNKETLCTDWIDNITNYQFENREYPGIAKYDAYLSYFYGDYMKLPPEDKRDHHGRLEVDFGPYQS